MRVKPTKRSRTKDEASELDELLTERNRIANKLRSKIEEFHGLERELIEFQEQMMVDYERTRPLKNARELGDTRENIVRSFLAESGLFPSRYGVSKLRARVASPSGHSSNELDIVFFDAVETVILMRRNNVAEVYPKECVLGTIQIKSNLDKTEIASAFENLASFKRLYDSSSIFSGPWSGRQPSNRGFGILFSFESHLPGEELFGTIEACARQHPVTHLPNAIFILSKGTILFSQDFRAYWHNDDMAKMTAPTPFSLPNQGTNCLWRFYEISLDLLRSTAISRPNVAEYFRLPLTAGNLSYYFQHGVFAEMGSCPKHGRFLRRISVENLRKIIEFCDGAESVNWIKALDMARGQPGDNSEVYLSQPGDVKIYNPDGKPLTDLLLSPVGNLHYDDLVIGNTPVWVPYFYSERDSLIDSCPMCRRRAKKAKAAEQRAKKVA
jgi:hypothetical protein